jgi:hypothetical protein
LCANLQFVVFSFCRGEKTTKGQDDKTIIIVFSPRKNDKSTKRKVDKTTKLRRKDEKHNPLSSDLICLFAWRFEAKRRLIIYGLTFRSKIFHLYGEVTIAGEGLQN